MHGKRTEIAVLEEQIRQGVPGAAERLRRLLEPFVIPIVGRALRPGQAASSLTRRIRALALQTAHSVGHRAEHPAWLIDLIARRLSERIIDELRRGLSTHRGLLDTLCA
jgi:hypothetical protein